MDVIRCYIAGHWKETGNRVTIHDPYRGESIGEVCVAGVDDVDVAVHSSAAAADSMANIPAYLRAELLNRAACLLRERGDRMAEAMACQTGKALRDCRSEALRSVETLELCAKESLGITGEVLPLDAVASGAGKLGFTMRFPVGVVAAITPFNAPLNLACHKIGPALAAGNSVVFKPPLEAAVVSNMIAEIFLDAGFPANAIQVVHGGSDTGHALVSHPLVSFINFTGSGLTAERILSAAGLKRTLFELGGNGATIVHSDANLAKASVGVVSGAFGLTGQSCASVQRVYVQNSILEHFLDMVVEQTRALKVGDPMDPSTDVGSLISVTAADRIESWVKEATEQGARLLCGGTRRGAVLEPTIILNPPPTSRVVCEEVFGPTMSILEYEEIDEALSAVNDSPWGLQAGIYTSSLDLGLAAARKLRVGGLNINGPSRGRTDVQPYGGVKLSGWGREGPRYAIMEMTEVRMITISPAF